MFGIVEEQRPITGNQIRRLFKPNIVNFETLNDKMLAGAVRYFKSLALGEDPKTGHSIRGWVGLRDSNTYDQPNLWGLEFRSIPPKGDPDAYRELLDSIQASMVNNDYGIKRQEIESWLSTVHQDGERLESLIAKQWYNRSWSALIKGAPAEVKTSTTLFERFLLKTEAKINKAVKMLFHDWSNDPLIMSTTEEVKKRVMKEQIRAITRITKGGVEPETAIADFLKNSGLYERVMRSINVDLDSV